MAVRQLAPLVLAVFVACVLMTIFVAPSYGLLDRGGPEASSPIVTEKFELPEVEEGTLPSDDRTDGIGAKESLAARQAAPGFASPLDDGPLERIEPRAPLSELSLALPPPPPTQAPGEVRYRLLHQPVATAAGRMEADGYIIEVKGIDIPSPDETCTDPAGISWPCGMQARTAFRAWLRARAVMCRLPATPSGEVTATDCTLGGEDVAAWLVDNGWARAKAGSPYADRGGKAEQARLGLFGLKPDTALPENTGAVDAMFGEPQPGEQ